MALKDLKRFPDENPSPVSRVSYNGNIIYLNQAFREVLGQLGDAQIEILPAIWLNHINIALKKGRMTTFELDLGGKTFLFEIVPVKGEDYLNIYGMDISLQKIALKAVEEERKKLAKSEEKYKEAFMESEFYKDLLMHDINNILQGILTSTEFLGALIEKKDQGVDLLKKQTRTIGDLVVKGTNLIKNIQKIIKLDKKEIDLKKIDLLNVLRQSVKNIKRIVGECPISVSISPQNVEYFVKADEFLIDAFENILLNAVLHNETKEAEIKIEISSEVKSGKNQVLIEFQDNGIGVPDEMKEIIFKRGFKKDKKVKGMGIGLSVVKRIIDKCGGSVWVEDIEAGNHKKGSKFIIELPEG